MGILEVLRTAIRRFRHDESGQDMIEYALLAAAVVVIVAAFLPPTIMPAISSIFSKISSTLGRVQ